MGLETLGEDCFNDENTPTLPQNMITQIPTMWARNQRSIFSALLLSVAVVLAGCSTSPALRLHKTAKTYQLTHIPLPSIPLRSSAFVTNTLSGASHAHIYLDGDGTPWFQGREPSIDPTPRSALVMKLLSVDTSPRLYLNRPCYGESRMSTECSPHLWTSDRYSEEVVGSMNSSIDILKAQYEIQSFSLIGYSGGAAIAVQLAKRRRDILQIVTIAGNLDHRKWTSEFNYLPLEHSLNAVDAFPLHHVPLRLHLIGKQDKHVPPQTNLEAAQRDVGAEIKTYEEFDHRCCWQDRWQEILELMAEQMSEQRRRHKPN